MKGFYFITDSRISRRGNISDVKSAIKSGVKVVQYRQKNKSASEMFEEALILRRLCKDIIFLVNDRVDIALAVGADGVHLGQDDFPLSAARKILGRKKIIGVTVHNTREAILAQRSGADYLGVSPIFPTSTKSDAGKPLGIATLKAIRNRVKIPIIALGGISLKNAKEVMRSGADGICAISAVVSKKDVRREIERFQKTYWEKGEQ
jgi:thiamine-phosphate pyrophosphorylase